MKHARHVRRLMLSFACLVLPVAQAPAIASDSPVKLRLSAGSSWQARNDIQIPNTELGTRFSLRNATGSGPTPLLRLELNWMMNKRHGLRLLLAPLSYTESVAFNEEVRFAGETFDSEQATEATYRFNSWRLGYHYSLMQTDRASMRVGATLKVRDAEIRLSQGNTTSFDDDVGFVPLLYLAGNYRLSNRWSMGADIDGLAGGPGRAIDLGLALDFTIDKRWQIGAEIRVLDGGADTEDVYNFARFNSGAMVLSAGF